jgi:mRNA interferase MazF
MRINSEAVFSYIDWMKLKLDINLSNKIVFPSKKEIWWASLGQNVGVEINGKHTRFERPVLIVHVFNAESILVVPITTKIKYGKYLHEFVTSFNEKRNANLSQLRSISTKRLLRKLEVINDNDFDQIIKKICYILQKAETPSSGVSSEFTNSEQST